MRGKPRRHVWGWLLAALAVAVPTFFGVVAWVRSCSDEPVPVMVISTSEANSVQESQDGSPGYRSEPTPKGIRDAVSDLPLALREEALDTYVGLKVRWRASLSSVVVDDSGIATLQMLAGGTLLPMVFCEVGVDDHPEVKLAREDDSLWVSGVISDVNAMYIELADCALELD